MRSLTTLRRIYRARMAYVFLFPGLVLFALFVIYPMLYSLRISFYDWNVIKPLKSGFVGLDNYRTLLSTPIFRRAVLNTLAYTIVTVPGQMIVALIVAILLNQNVKGKTFFRVAYYLPVITSWVIVTLIFEYLFNSQAGLIFRHSCHIDGHHWCASLPMRCHYELIVRSIALFAQY